MKSRYFREVEKTRSGKPWSRYNVVPDGLDESTTTSCESCGYRTDRLRELFVGTILSFMRNAKKYDARKYCNFTPNCDRERCLLDKLVLSRGAKAPSSLLKRLLKYKKLDLT